MILPFFPQQFLHFCLLLQQFFQFSFFLQLYPTASTWITAPPKEFSGGFSRVFSAFLEFSRVFSSILEISRDLSKLPCSVHTKYFSRHLCQRPRKKNPKKVQWKKSTKKFVPKFVGRLRWLSYLSLHALSPCVTTYSICIHTHTIPSKFSCVERRLYFIFPRAAFRILQLPGPIGWIYEPTKHRTEHTKERSQAIVCAFGCV